MMRLTLAVLLAAAANGAEFFSGQAARAVLGQPTFSSRDAGIAASAMAVQGNRLNVADQGGHVAIFDLSKLPAPQSEVIQRENAVCQLCGLSPVMSILQTVAPQSSTVSLSGKRLAAVDLRTHQILIWSDISAQRASAGPDVKLSLADPGVTAINDSTIIDPISVAIDGSRLFVGDAALHRVLVWKSLPVAPNQPADAVLGQPNFFSREASDDPRAGTISRPDALVSDGTNLFVGDSRFRRVLIFSPADSLLSPASILNSGTLTSGSFAPGTLVTIKGDALAMQEESAPDDQPAPLPTRLGGVRVYLDGGLLPLLSVAKNEIRAQLPYSIPASGSGSIYVRAEHADGSVSVTTAAAVTLTSASPGIFAFSGPEPRPGILLHADGFVGSGSPVTTEEPALPGEVLNVWVTGLHVVLPSNNQLPKSGVPSSGDEFAFTPVHAIVNGQDAEVVSVTLPPSSIGVYQVQLLLPNPISRERAELSISEDGYTSNVVTFPSRERAPQTP